MDQARRLAGLTRRNWPDLLRAVAELAIARIRLARRDAESFLAVPAEPRAASVTPLQAQLLDRIAFAIPRAAARVPWKASCLVQALAARRWLTRSGIPSELKLGARMADAGALDAHAWLEAGGKTVVGGDTGAYQPFSRPREG